MVRQSRKTKNPAVRKSEKFLNVLILKKRHVQKLMQELMRSKVTWNILWQKDIRFLFSLNHRRLHLYTSHPIWEHLVKKKWIFIWLLLFRHSSFRSSSCKSKWRIKLIESQSFILRLTLPSLIVGGPPTPFFRKFATRFPTIPTPPIYDFGRQSLMIFPNPSQFFEIRA